MTKKQNHIYLSPAFSKRTDDEREFLAKISGTTGFSLFWIDVVKPLLCEIKAHRLIEIGADEGEHTQLLLKYCDAFDAHLLVIEPAVKAILKEIVKSSSRIRLINEKSQKALPNIDAPVDAVFLEGDLNYYSTKEDLRAIEELTYRQNIEFPLVFIRSTSWPYARRDMYYDPDSIPITDKHGYERIGMTPWSSELVQGMINESFANVKYEGGQRNGVLTAVEDFMRDSELDLQLFSLPVNNGLGIIYNKNSQVEVFIKTNLLPPPALGLFLETCELARLNEIIRRIKAQQNQQPRSTLARLLRWFGRKIIEVIER